jgi:predicted N-formylglutamate amidohydrolase
MTRSAVFAPFEIVDGDRSRSMVILADHARREMPEEYGTLGLPESDLERHIAYDIGVEGVTRRIAAELHVPAILCGFSRLLIDPNRGEDDPTMIRQLYDGTIITGNYPMSEDERELRLSRFYRPYHDAVSSLIASVAHESGKAPLIVSIHSFTPKFQGTERRWHLGILWDLDDRAPKMLFDMLGGQDDIVVGDNEPYDGALRGDTMYRHAITNGFAHALLEIRQDLIRYEDGQDSWAGRLAPVLDAINRLDDIHEVRRYGSRTGPVANGD